MQRNRTFKVVLEIRNIKSDTASSIDADLLQEADRTTLLILDDALVNTDDDRLGQMKWVLFDAAQRHQVLIFTCHPAAWRDLGVVARWVGG